MSFLTFLLVDIGSFDMKSIPQTISANVGESIILPVPPIKSVPFPEITWFNGTKSLKVESKRYDFTVNHSLVLLNLSPHDDSRTFHVRANNTLDEPVSSESFTIFITSKKLSLLIVAILNFTFFSLSFLLILFIFLLLYYSFLSNSNSFENAFILVFRTLVV